MNATFTIVNYQTKAEVEIASTIQTLIYLFIYEIWWVKNIPLLVFIALLVYLWVLCYSYFCQYC